MIHPYWASWAIAFPNDPLGWSGANPWRELDHLRVLSARELASAAGQVLLDGHRTVVLTSPAFTEECAVTREGRCVAFLDPPRVPELDVALERLAEPISYRCARVGSLAGGRVLFLADPQVRVVDVTGYYPLGIQEEGTRAYAERLRATLPEGFKEGESVLFARDRIGFRFRLSMSNDPGEALGRLHAWLAAPVPQPDAPGGGWPGFLPGMSFRHEG